MPTRLFEGQQIDDLARRDLRQFAETQGHGPDIVRINQRLYLQNGSYRVPDVYFPRSGAILDGTIGFKTPTMPQIRDFGIANGGAPIVIVRPLANGGSYRIGQ